MRFRRSTTSGINLDFYNNRSIDKQYADQPKREMAIHTSRGCPFLCVFCSNPSLHGRKVRTMSIERVVSDVRRMKEEFGMTVLLLEDDHFFNDKDRAKQILRELAALDIRVEFPNGVAVYAIDDEVAELFSKAGVSAVALAVESGSDHVLNNIIRKPLKKRLIRPAVEALRKFNVRSHVFIVIGLPGEQDEHRDETLQMLLDSGFDWVHVYLAMPIFGSRLYDICVENGYIENTQSQDFVATKSVIRAPGVDPVKLEAYRLRDADPRQFRREPQHEDRPLRRADGLPEERRDQIPRSRLRPLLPRPSAIAKPARRALADEHLGRFLDICERDDWWSDMAEKYGVHFRAAIRVPARRRRAIAPAGVELARRRARSHALQKAVRRGRDRDLVLDRAIVFEAQVAAVARLAAFALQALHVFPHRGLRIVAFAPGAIGAHLFRQVLDAGVPDDAVRALADIGRVKLELFQHVIVGVIGIEEHHDALVALRMRGDLRRDLGRDRRALDRMDLVAHRMGVDGRAVVRRGYRCRRRRPCAGWPWDRARRPFRSASQ